MLKVVLVDDEPFISQGMAVVIDWKTEGFEIAAIHDSAVTALEYLKENPVDLVITDIKMPEMTGLELMEKTRSELGLKTYFVILSGYRDFAYVRTAMQNECIDYLLKPVNREELLAVLRKVRGMSEEAAAQLLETPPDTGNARLSPTPLENGDGEGGADDAEPPELRGSHARSVLLAIDADMKRDYRENLTLKDFSTKYYLNPTYLGQLFRKEFGESFKDHLNRIRVEAALPLLIQTDKKIYEIAEEVGYKDLDYFIEKFIAVQGVTPTKFRRQK